MTGLKKDWTVERLKDEHGDRIEIYERGEMLLWLSIEDAKTVRDGMGAALEKS